VEQAGVLRYLSGGLIAGAAAAAINIAYALAYSAATGFSHPLVAPANVAASSLLPALLGGLVWYGLSRVTPKAQAIMTAVAVLAGIGATVFGFVQTTLPDGTAKPPGLQGLVQPMHAVVPLALIVILPWWLRRRS
jgi:hypothetical protein